MIFFVVDGSSSSTFIDCLFCLCVYFHAWACINFTKFFFCCFFFFFFVRDVSPWSEPMPLVVIAECYTSSDEQNCRKTNNEHDEIFWKRKCTSILSICEEHSYTAINASYCADETMKLVPIQKIIKRVLASEEYY